MRGVFLKGDMGTLPGVLNVLYLEFGGGSVGLCICKKPSDCALKINALCVLYIC